MELYINSNGEQHGPFSMEEAQGHLAAGRFQATDLAWYEGLAEWTSLGEVAGPAVAAAPAPPAAPVPGMPPAPAAAPAALAAGKTTLAVRIALGVILVVVGVLVGLDHLARGKFTSAQEFLDEVNESVPLDHLTKEFGRDPVSSKKQHGEVVDRYVWKGPLRVYTLDVTYSVNNATKTMFVESSSGKVGWRFAGGDEDSDDSDGSSDSGDTDKDGEDFDFGEPQMPGGPGGPGVPGGPGGPPGGFPGGFPGGPGGPPGGGGGPMVPPNG